MARVDVTPGRARLATPVASALLLVAGVGVGLLANETLRRWRAPEIESDVVPAPTPPLAAELVDLGTLSPPDRFELALFAVLAVLRLLLPLVRRRRLLEPLVDLPLLGLLIAVGGGSLSPLDPTLPLAYVAAILFLRGAESGRVTPGRLTLELLVGLAAIHLVVQRHDGRRLEAGAAEQVARVRAEIGSIRAEHGSALASVDEGLGVVPDAAAVGATLQAAAVDPAALPAFTELRGCLADAQRRFAGLLAALTPDVGADALGDLKIEWQQALDRTYDDYFRARETWRAARPPPQADRSVASLDDLRETQWLLRQGLLDRIDDLEGALVERDRLRARERGFLRSSTWRRAAIFGALLLFAAVAIVLRDRLSRAVRDAEERRARREVELAEREKEHWIALTAGLTHGLGNDILAYDVYFAELAQLLASKEVAAPPRALELLRFLADSNRGRLGFLQFLDAFARQRQAAAGDAPAIAFEPLDLPQLLQRVRANLARVEIADLPAEGTDPAVDRRIRILRDLPLEIAVADESARTLRRGHRGVVEFFAYELVKNALRSATGERPLSARLRRAGDRLELALENDVAVDESEGACPRCGSAGPLRRIRRRRDAPPACARCLGPALQELLDGSFEPGKGSGTGLGLFLIRYFLGTFWNGEIRASLGDVAVPTVVFTLALPDPL